MASSFDNFFEYAKSEGLKFDVITFFEVIEHLTDLKKFLNQVRELLNDGGIVIASTPDRNRFLADLTRLDLDFPLITSFGFLEHL